MAPVTRRTANASKAPKTSKVTAKVKIEQLSSLSRPEIKTEENVSPCTPPKEEKTDFDDYDYDPLPHGLDLDIHQSADSAELSSPKKRIKGKNGKPLPVKVTEVKSAQKVQVYPKNLAAIKTCKVLGPLGTPVSKSSGSIKRHPYGLTPGVSPYPEPDQKHRNYQEVLDALETLHGSRKAPKVIPPPSLEITGCGEVPNILDALIRTYISSATASTNSDKAMKGLQQRFGMVDGHIDWGAVHRGTLQSVFESILSAGLAHRKANCIKEILDNIYQMNCAKLKELELEKLSILDKDIATSEKEQAIVVVDAKLAALKEDMLSMDYLFSLDKDDAMNEMMKLPGIAVKTSACVTLFCMQRPCFAVDTHCWRLSKWLGWVPENATRDQTFQHLEVYMPDSLKYPLHQLFVKHGKSCLRCQANPAKNDAWRATICPLEKLLDRSLGAKTTKSKAAKITSKAAKRSKRNTEDIESEHGDEEYED